MQAGERSPRGSCGQTAPRGLVSERLVATAAKESLYSLAAGHARDADQPEETRSSSSTGSEVRRKVSKLAENDETLTLHHETCVFK